MKKEFMSQSVNLEILFDMAINSYGSSKYKNIFVSVVTLICECGFNLIEEYSYPKKIQDAKDSFADEPGADI